MVYSNVVHMDYIMRGTLYILPMGVYVNDNSMANILSLKELADFFCVTMDTKEYHAMLLCYSKNKVYRFKSCGKFLYYLYVSNTEIITLMNGRGNTYYSFLSTVNVKVEYFTRTDIEGADR